MLYLYLFYTHTHTRAHTHTHTNTHTHLYTLTKDAKAGGDRVASAPGEVEEDVILTFVVIILTKDAEACEGRVAGCLVWFCLEYFSLVNQRC